MEFDNTSDENPRPRRKHKLEIILKKQNLIRRLLSYTESTKYMCITISSRMWRRTLMQNSWSKLLCISFHQKKEMIGFRPVALVHFTRSTSLMDNWLLLVYWIYCPNVCRAITCFTIRTMLFYRWGSTQLYRKYSGWRWYRSNTALPWNTIIYWITLILVQNWDTRQNIAHQNYYVHSVIDGFPSRLQIH